LLKRSRQSDRLRITVKDIAKCVVDLSVTLPDFHEKKLSPTLASGWRQFCDVMKVYITRVRVVTTFTGTAECNVKVERLRESFIRENLAA